jgi:hypothetical protein
MDNGRSGQGYLQRKKKAKTGRRSVPKPKPENNVRPDIMKAVKGRRK